LNQQRFGVAQKMQSDRATAENKKPGGVHGSSLPHVAPLNIDDGMGGVSHPKIFASVDATGTE
jgi:hypothetical protein